MSIKTRPWARQPTVPVVPDYTNGLLRSIGLMFLSNPTKVYFDPANHAPWIQSGAQVFHASAGSYGGEVYGPRVDATHYIYQTFPQPPAAGWTIAAVVGFSAGASLSTRYIGFCQSPGSGTNDREITLDANFFYSGEVFDGATKQVSSVVAPAIGRTDVVVVTCTASLISIFVNGLAPVTLAVSNSGFGYTGNPAFCLGNCSNGLPTGMDASLVLMVNRPWTNGEAFKWMDNPWQVFKPKIRRLWFHPSAAVTPVLQPWWFQGNQGALIAQ